MKKISAALILIIIVLIFLFLNINAVSNTETETNSEIECDIISQTESSNTDSSSVIESIESEKATTEDGIILPDYFNRKDDYGQYTVNILGDSISHGSNAKDIPNESYAGLFKKSIGLAWKDSDNYGYVSMHADLNNTSGHCKEIHSIIKNGEWKDTVDRSLLGYYGLSTIQKGAYLRIIPNKPYKYISVFFMQDPQGGEFDIYINGNLIKTFSTKGENNKTSRTEIIKAGIEGAKEIKIVSKTQNPIIINGIGYYNNTEGVTVNNYSISGLKLIDVDDELIRRICNSSVVIISIGHNDMFIDCGNVFTNKINIIRDEIIKNGSKLIVNDFTWNQTHLSGNYVRKELKRLSDECNGIFNTFDLNNYIEDGSHPSVEGHKIIARKLCENFEIPFYENN